MSLVLDKLQTSACFIQHIEITLNVCKCSFYEKLIKHKENAYWTANSALHEGALYHNKNFSVAGQMMIWSVGLPETQFFLFWPNRKNKKL